MIARRNALRLGLAGSVVALSGRSAARAADSLTIGPDAVNIDNLAVARTVRTQSLTVSGDATLQKTLMVDGDTTLKGDTGIQKGLVVDGDATLKKSLTVAGADGARSLRVTPTAGANMLDVQAAQRTTLKGVGKKQGEYRAATNGEASTWEGKHETGLALYVTADSDPAGKGVEFRHSNGTQGIGFGYNTIYATGTIPDQDLVLKARGTGSVRIIGTVEAKDFAAIEANPLRNRMFPAEPLVYQDIFDALSARAIQKLGNPNYDDTSFKQSSLFGDRHIIKFGGNNEADGNGAAVTIPTGYDTVWVRVLGERWNVIHAYFLETAGDLGLWTGGFRSANCYAPDGSLTDGYAAAHQWLPIPAGRAGKLALVSKSNTDKEFWISGLAFSKNPWAHAAQSGVGYHWAVNGGSATTWNTHNWNDDTLATIGPKTKLVLRVPVISSGRDKLLYLIEHNSNWNGTMHTAITVEGKPVERFMATYDNPFSRHWNSKSFERYIATRIPTAHIPANARYLNVIIDMTKQDKEINFREIGTHDLAVPWPDQAAG